MADESLRLFIALPVPEPVKDAMARAQAEIRSALPEKAIRWTKRDQLHVTLRFLGSVDGGRAEELIASVRGACEHFGALELRAGGLGVFPDARRPRVVWIGVADPQNRLAALQRAVEAASAAFTSEKPEPSFTGHVTLGRCRTVGRKEAVRLAALARDMEGRRFGEWTADRVELVRSELGPDGSRHTPLAVLAL